MRLECMQEQVHTIWMTVGRPLVVPEMQLSLRRARARKSSRIMVHAWKYANRRLQTGYKSLILVQAEAPQVEMRVQSVWPNDLVNSWIKETNFQQVQSMAQRDLFDLPQTSSEPLILLSEWSYDQNDKPYSTVDIEVVLVTQCSLDRLKKGSTIVLLDWKSIHCNTLETWRRSIQSRACNYD